VAIPVQEKGSERHFRSRRGDASANGSGRHGIGRGDSRAGSRVLAVFENPLNTRILRAHAGGACQRGELQEKLGWCAEATVRAAVANLCDIGALTRLKDDDGASTVATALCPAGQEMLFVADVLEDWLALCPQGVIAPDGEQAKQAIKALSGGWSTTLMRELARHPFTLAELSKLIPDVSYSALERRVTWMRTTGQIEPLERQERGTPYVVTDWLRQSIAPIAAAGRCELRHMQGEAVPITQIEVEAAFLLALPLAPLPEHAAGECVLALQATDPSRPGKGDPELVGVTVNIRAGNRTVKTIVDHEPRIWAVGAPDAWLDAVIDGRLELLRVGGANPQFAADLAHGVHLALFPDR